MYKLTGKLFGLILLFYTAKKPISYDNAIKLQKKLLLKLVKAAKKTKFGIDHKFAEIKNLREFQKNIPIRDYQAFWQEYWSDKFPILDNVTWAGRDRYYPPNNLAIIKDWQQKLEKISVDCLNKNIRSINGLPSWLQILFEKIFTNSSVQSTALISYFPNLELIVHGGMSLKPYYGYFNNITKNTNIDIREVYAASEGFFAIADRNYNEGLRLIVNNGIFYEFIKAEEINNVSAKRYWIEDVKENTNYAIIVTTNAGLWSYVVGDIIRFNDVKNLRIMFVGRLSQTLSIFGEKIVNEELELAVATATAKMGLNFHDFAVGSVFLKDMPAKGQHKFIIEFKETLAHEQEQQLAKIIDAELVKSNSGYATRRKNEINIVAPTVISIPNGSFTKWMKQKGKMGGQNKVPRVLEPEQLNDLLALKQ